MNKISTNFFNKINYSQKQKQNQKQKQDIENEEECVICMGSLNVECCNNIFTSICGHKFHRDCLFKWCKQNNSCPICRRKDVITCQISKFPIDSSGSIIYNYPFYHITENENTTSTIILDNSNNYYNNNIIINNNNLSNYYINNNNNNNNIIIE